MSQYKEVLEKLKNSGLTVVDFAHEHSPSNFEDYPEALDAKINRDVFRARNCIDYKWDSEKAKEEYFNLPNEFDIIDKLWKERLGLEWEEIDKYGGEDCGSTWYSVKYFPKEDLYIRVDGWYQSHYGTDFEDWDKACSEVKPKTKTITVYE